MISWLNYKHLLTWWILELSSELKKRANYIKQWNKKNPEKQKRNAKNSYTRHKKARLSSMKEWAKSNSERQKEIRKNHYWSNREDYIKDAADWNKTNKTRRNLALRKRDKIRTGIDENYRLVKNLRSRIWWALQRKTVKSAKTLELLGCSIPQLKAYLEKQFQPGMTWENYGPVWHVDHIRPCADFKNLADPAQQRECFNYTNLQPLWAKDNLSKGAKYGG